MHDEIQAAVAFLSKIVERSHNLSNEQLETFTKELVAILGKRFENHWHGDRPTKGQAYRCLRVHESEPRDPVLLQAANTTGVRYEDLQLPSELTVWVDPREVSCR